MTHVKRKLFSVLVVCTMLAACSSSDPDERQNRIDEAFTCDDFNVDHTRGRLGFVVDKKGQPIDEVDPKLGYEHVNIEDCAVRLVDPRQLPSKEQYGVKFYRLYQEEGETFSYVGEQELGRVHWIDWDDGTVSTEVLESYWYVLPIHAFRCAPNEINRPQNAFTCSGKIVRGVEASTYKGTGWDVSTGVSTPQIKGVELKFTGARSGKTEETVVVTQQIAPEVVWVDKYPVVWNAVLVRKEKRLYMGVGKPCYRVPRLCLDWSKLAVVVTATSLISTRTNNWDQLMAEDGDWRKTITQGNYARYPFRPGEEPTFSTEVPNRPQREEISGSVRALAASWQKKHTYMNETDLSLKGDAKLVVFSVGYGEVTSKAFTDGTSTAVEIKYSAPDGVSALCLTVMDIVKEDPPVTGISLEGCR